MTVKELITQEEKKPGIKIGDNVALEIWETNSSDEIYYEQNKIPSSHCDDYADLVDAKVAKWEYITGFGYMDAVVRKLKIVIEVE